MAELYHLGRRIDGRQKNDIRKISIQLGRGNADGSCLYTQGNTKVLVNVFGPRGSKTRSEMLDDEAKVLCKCNKPPFAGGGERQRKVKNDRKMETMASVVEEIFQSVASTELYPMSEIDVHVEVLQADGSELSAVINAASLALADAGIPMVDMVCSTTAGMIDQVPVLDLNGFEETARIASMILATLAHSDRVVFVSSVTAHTQSGNAEKLMTAARSACGAVYEVLDRGLKEHIVDSINPSHFV